MTLRIERIDFSPWGCFENHSLPLSARVGDVDLVHGRNASGKSTTSRGERSLLYGIDQRTVDNHTYDYADLRIGARLRLDGLSVELERRKRRLGSLVGPNGQTLPDDLLLEALGGLSANVYEALFQVDNETLVRGGAELLQGQGEIGASLFAAAAGIASLHRTLADFEGEADRLFNPRGRTSVLHKRLNDLRDAERRLRESTLRPARHREMTRALQQDEQACADATAALRELDRDVREIERKRAIAPLLDARATLLDELASIGETADLPDDATARRLDARGRISAGTLALERARKALGTLDSGIAAIAVDTPLIAHGDEIRAIKESVAAVNKAAGDRRKREGELQEAKAALAVAATTVGVAATEIDSLRRPLTARRALDDCLREGDELAAALRSVDTRRNEAARDRDDARAALAAAPISRDVAPLEAALAAALKAGPIAEQIEQFTIEAKVTRRDAAARLRRLTPAPPALTDLLSLEAPPRSESLRAVAMAEELRRASEELDGESRRLVDDETALAEEQRRLELEGEAPSAEELAGAREARDAHWTRIRAAGVDGTLSSDDCDGFEHALADADHLADSRTDHAAQIERTAAVHARVAKLARERAEHEWRQQELREREAAAAAAWATCWATTGLDLLPVEDVSAWLDDREAIIALVRAADEAQEHADALSERAGRLGQAIAAELRALDEEMSPEASLDALIARAERAVGTTRAAATARATLETTLALAERALAGAEADRDRARVAREAWNAAWPSRRDEAGLPLSTTPAAAQEIARAIDEGLAQLAKIADLERRIAGIDADRRDVEAAVNTLCGELAADLSALPALRAVALLEVRLGDQESAQARRDALLEQRATQAEELGALEDEVAGAQAEIDELVALAGAHDVGELHAIEAAAGRAKVLRQEIAAMEGRVAEVGEGRFSALAASTNGFDRAQAAIEVEELRDRADELRAERDEIKERIGERRHDLADAENDIAAVEAVQDVALARAAVSEAAVAHAKAKLAAAVVRRAIERYRAQHQDPLLRRANELFKRFTLGSFVELFVDVDDRGSGVLIGRQRDRVLKRVPQMSKGTREQLFLALRIAAIERYVASAGAVPVIFDDVFVESDPPRSERIFEALGELATMTQVIVLTHHEHLIEVGRRALGDRLVAQDLPDAAPTLREAAAA